MEWGQGCTIINKANKGSVIKFVRNYNIDGNRLTLKLFNIPGGSQLVENTPGVPKVGAEKKC